MRIALLTTGLVKYTSLLANALVDNCSVCFVGLQYRNDVARDEDFQKSVRSWFRPEVQICLPSKWRKRDPRNLWAVARAVRYLRAWKPDLIHIQVDYDYRIALTLLAMRQTPCVDTIHDARPHLGEYELYARKLDWNTRHPVRRHARRIIVHGNAIKRELMSSDKISADKIVVIPHPAYELFKRYRDPHAVVESNCVLFFGRIWPYKGLDVLIQAEPEVSATFPDVTFLVAGEGQDLEPYRAAMVHPERFEVHNRYLSDQEVARYFERAAIVVAPYREASQSGVIAIAFVMGRPVIVTSVGALAEAVTHGVTGLVIPPEDPKALALAIIQLLKDPDLRARMGEAGAAMARGPLSAARVAKETIEVYRAILIRS